MQGKKFKFATILVIGLLILTGCGSTTKSSKAANHKATTSSVKKNSNKKSISKDGSNSSSTSSSKSSVVSTKKTSTLWNSAKDKQLETFINKWAPTMKQSYVKYDGKNSIKTSTGTLYPDDLDKVLVNGAKTSIGWSKNGDGSYSYNVVAIYNYNGTEPPLPNHITYFFTFHDGEPVALVDQSNNGTPSLTTTTNTKVQSNFSQIAGGTSTISTAKSTSSNSSANTTKIDDKTIGVLVSLLANSDWFKEYVDNTMWYGTNYGSGDDQVKGYSYMTAHGDPTSYIYYKVSGNTVTYKVWMPRDSVANGYFKTKTTTLARLENDYYSTSSQKSEVQNYVNKVKPESSYSTGN
ncbi:Lreu_0056 family protein [Pediococcus siamensis]|uniref:Lreu_0056 family protein n=1 Tax=Pediococcus siamensis TaxID=381829 RepID=UPI0039A07ED2